MQGCRRTDLNPLTGYRRKGTKRLFAGWQRINEIMCHGFIKIKHQDNQPTR